MGIWQDMKKGLLVVNYTSIDELKKYRQALIDSGLNIHECAILAVVKTKAEKNSISAQNSVVFIADGEMNLFGKLKNADANTILSRKYDLVIFVGDFSKKMMKTISKTKKTIGVSLNSNNNSQRLNLTTDSKIPAHLINFAKETLQKIV